MDMSKPGPHGEFDMSAFTVTAVNEDTWLDLLVDASDRAAANAAFQAYCAADDEGHQCAEGDITPYAGPADAAEEARAKGRVLCIARGVNGEDAMLD
jgi:hypothetical protein